MNGMGEHAKTKHGNHLWILAVIAAAAAIPVGAGWVGLGNIAGFPVIFGQSTGWTLVVSLEAYGGYAVYIWLGAAPGERSRQFAQRSAIGVLALSLIGQASYHLMLARHAMRLPALVVVFAACLPVVVLSLAAILMHLCHADERAAEEAERRKAETERQAAIKRAEADERTALRAELEAMHDGHASDMSALRGELEAEQSARESAQSDHAEALARAEKAEQRLATASAQKRHGKSGRNAQGGDLTTELRAIQILDANPDLRKPRMGGELARRLGVSPATGRRLHSQLTAENRPSESLSEDAQ